MVRATPLNMKYRTHLTAIVLFGFYTALIIQIYWSVIRGHPHVISTKHRSWNRSESITDAISVDQIYGADAATEKNTSDVISDRSMTEGISSPEPVHQYQNTNLLAEDCPPIQGTKYIFPYIQCGGPNWFYENFLVTARFAVHHKRTLVLPTFMTHKLDTESFEEKSFNETFDYQILRKMLPLATQEDFVKDCGSVVNETELLIDPFLKGFFYSYYRGNYNKRRSRDIQNARMPIILPPFTVVPKTAELALTHNRQAICARCLVMFHPWDLKSLNAPDDSDRNIDSHLLRAPYIRDMAEEIVDNLCDGQQYVLLHWRNRSSEICLNDSAYSKQSLCTPEKQAYYQLFTNKRIMSTVAMAISDFISSHNIKCLYVAHPRFEQEIIKSLKDIVPHLYTVNDVMALSSDLHKYKDDNYVISLVEQEIAEKAEIFIRWSKSFWSDMVQNKRDLNNKTTVVYNELPGIPRQLHYKIIS
ncbi:uncharacterized protein LOC102806520 [Saccoglossus kowalevskii]